jgi:hypothetical protein
MKNSAQIMNRVLLDEPSKFANKARTPFVKAIGIAEVSLKEVRQARNEMALVLRGPGGVNVGGNQIALPLNVGVGQDYWLSAKLVLEPFQARYALKNISITVHRGLAGSDKLPVLRAEWDCPVSIKNDHAQPHWHAYPNEAMSGTVPKLSEQALQDEATIFEFVPEDTDVVADDSDPIKKIHLAMCATWHLPASEYRVPLNSETQAFMWIENCTKYLVDQIASLA